MVLLTVFLYVPILATARSAGDIVVGLNYVFDTLMFGGAILLLALNFSQYRMTMESEQPAEISVLQRS